MSIRRGVSPELSRDGALCSGADETGVLGEDATGIARREGLPAFTAGAQLSLVDE
jgi:hypothetical protein